MRIKKISASASISNLKEAIELTKISESLFQKKLSNLKKEIYTTNNQDKKEELIKKVNKLYLQYEASLSIINRFIDENTKII